MCLLNQEAKEHSAILLPLILHLVPSETSDMVQGMLARSYPFLKDASDNILFQPHLKD